MIDIQKVGCGLWSWWSGSGYG